MGQHKTRDKTGRRPRSLASQISSHSVPKNILMERRDEKMSGGGEVLLPCRKIPIPGETIRPGGLPFNQQLFASFQNLQHPLGMQEGLRERGGSIWILRGYKLLYQVGLSKVLDKKFLINLSYSFTSVDILLYEYIAMLPYLWLISYTFVDPFKGFLYLTLYLLI